MQPITNGQGQGPESTVSDKTVNVKRTTLVSAICVALALLTATSILGLYAANKALTAARNVDEQWQMQHARILSIEASVVKASADAAEVKANQARIIQDQNELSKRLTNVSLQVQQAASYQATKDAMAAESAAEMQKIADQKADTAKQVEAAEQKGLENFDRLLANRLHDRWQRPVKAIAGSKAEIVVQFAQDGTITNAAVVSTAGDAEVDQSIIAAAVNVGKIPELATVDRSIYLKHLQQRRIVFQM